MSSEQASGKPERSGDAEPSRGLTRLEHRIDSAAHRILAGRPATGARAALTECAVFLFKQAWACVCGCLLYTSGCV